MLFFSSYIYIYKIKNNFIAFFKLGNNDATVFRALIIMIPSQTCYYMNKGIKHSALCWWRKIINDNVATKFDPFIVTFNLAGSCFHFLSHFLYNDLRTHSRRSSAFIMYYTHRIFSGSFQVRSSDFPLPRYEGRSRSDARDVAEFGDRLQGGFLTEAHTKTSSDPFSLGFGVITRHEPPLTMHHANITQEKATRKAERVLIGNYNKEYKAL